MNFSLSYPFAGSFLSGSNTSPIAFGLYGLDGDFLLYLIDAINRGFFLCSLRSLWRKVSCYGGASSELKEGFQSIVVEFCAFSLLYLLNSSVIFWFSSLSVLAIIVPAGIDSFILPILTSKWILSNESINTVTPLSLSENDEKLSSIEKLMCINGLCIKYWRAGFFLRALYQKPDAKRLNRLMNIILCSFIIPSMDLGRD